MARHRRPIRIPTTIVLALAILAAACGSDASSDLGAELDGREFWSTEVIENGSPRLLVEGTRIILRFDPGSIGASAGCNSLGGNAEFDGDRLVTTELFQTEMGCDPERHAQDEFVIGVISDRPVVAIDGDELSLTTDTVTIRLLDADVANPDRPIIGTTWTVDGFDDGQAATSFSIERPATFAFEDQSSWSGFDGCGDFTGSVEVADGSTGGPVEGDGELQFGPVDWVPIEDCEATEYVSSLRRVIDGGQASFTIDGANLRIVNRDGLALTARAG